MRCAVKVQRNVPSYDGDQPPDRAIRFRVGINIGDAIADGTDLHGDAVNVVARLQAECPPGAICVSRSVRDHVHARLNLEFDELGVLDLKNIARPVEAFILRADIAAMGGCELIPLRTIKNPFTLSGKPSVAVLAFTNMSRDADQEYFSDGIADDIITELSRSRSLFVVSRNSSFTYKGRPIDVRKVASELGVRYVVEGSVRRSSGRIRITAQLSDGSTGSHIWADRFDGDLSDVFALQDRVVEGVVSSLEPSLQLAEATKALYKPTDSLDAYDCYLRALLYFHAKTRESLAEAVGYLGRAIGFDPNYALAKGFLAYLLFFRNAMGWASLPKAISQ